MGSVDPLCGTSAWSDLVIRWTLLLAACSAPEIAPLPRARPPGSPPLNAPPSRPLSGAASAPGAGVSGGSAPGGAPSATPVSPPPAGPPPATIEVTPTDLDDLADVVPFTAWTADAPLTLVGPGGVTFAELRKVGIRVEVVQVLEHRVRVRCTACAERDVEGWLPRGHLRAPGAPGALRDPLAVALRWRARWASGGELPDGARHTDMCALIDHGFEIEDDGGATVARWSLGEGVVDLRLQDGDWLLGEVTGAELEGWRCRTSGMGYRP